jgi:hypothetical protein
MHVLNNNRLAWSVAIASLALWLTSAPVSWGGTRADTAGSFEQSEDGSADTPPVDAEVGETLPPPIDASAQNPLCPVIPPAIAQLVPSPTTPGPALTGPEGTFHMCGENPQAARAIEQLIAGRGFSARLTARGDGCADLTIRVTSGMVNGSNTSNASVSLGSGRNLSIQLVSEHGVTHASIVTR